MRVLVTELGSWVQQMSDAIQQQRDQQGRQAGRAPPRPGSPRKRASGLGDMTAGGSRDGDSDPWAGVASLRAGAGS